MSTWLRVLAGSIVVLALAVAIALPNGYVCRAQDGVEVHRQWSFGQERWFYGCFPSREVIESGAEFRHLHPTDAATDRRVALRVVVAIAGLALALAVVVLSTRRDLLDSASDSQGQPAPSSGRRTWILVTVYALFGATIAVLVTLRQDDYWVRGTFGPSFSIRSFLGWNMTPILAETLVAIVGVAGGIALGLLVSDLYRRVETSRALIAAREST